MEKELTIDILSSVQKLARYTGGEFNSIVKTSEETEVSIALAFPDIYEVGMSYLGFKILYHILNLENGIAAERVYAPWVDMEAKMRANAIPLRTLETEKVLQDFDFVGFTLQYELSYTNILNMLDLGRIPVKTEERTEKDPFIIVGGPCVYNPEPLADFFDLAVVGEGEEVMVELMDTYKKWKREGKPAGRQGFLQRAVAIKGIYVPSFYDVAYNEDGTVAAVVPNCDAAPAAVEKRVISDMNTVNYPTAPIVPFGEIVHDAMQQGTENQKYDATTSFLDNAEEGVLDAQGRFTVNQRLKEAAALTNESTVVFKGKGEVIEIWNTDEYERIYNSYDHTQGIYDLMDKVKGNEQ